MTVSPRYGDGAEISSQLRCGGDAVRARKIAERNLSNNRHAVL
jgi:hypothetical protein